MALTAADKAWIRKAFREEVEAVLVDYAAAQTGGYDGATDVSEEDDGSEQGRGHKHSRIGFTVGTMPHNIARRALMRKLK
ncbi:MAG TPA: hypothetical protein VIR54_03365 [Vicinamibacterales bacterium]